MMISQFEDPEHISNFVEKDLSASKIRMTSKMPYVKQLGRRLSVTYSPSNLYPEAFCADEAEALLKNLKAWFDRYLDDFKEGNFVAALYEDE